MDELPIKIHKWFYPISWIYNGVVKIRNMLFDKGLLPSKSFKMPVIGIGNLTVGGTGKTPHVEYLIELLCKEYHLAVLSRGYKRQTHGFILATSRSTTQTIGDEPYQIHRKFPSVIVAVDEKRSHGIENLLTIRNPSVDVILLDDAFQHRYVKPGLSILLTDYYRLFCDDTLLPAGRLRESIHGKDRAQIVIVTKCPPDIKFIDYNIITTKLDLSPHQQLFFSTFHYEKLRPMFSVTDSDTNEKREEILLSALADTNVLLVTGIASPDSLFTKLMNHAKRVSLLTFSDHHFFTDKDIEQIKKRFQQLDGEQKMIITTEKDAMRLINHPSLDAELKSVFYILPIKIEFLQNQQDKFDQHIIDYVRKNKRDSRFSKRKDAFLS